MTLQIVPENFYDDATLTTEFAPVAGFAVYNTKDTQRSRVWRTTSGTDQYIAGTYADGISRTASSFHLFRHRCHGGSVRLRLYSDTAWTTQVYDSTALPVINITPVGGYNWGYDLSGGSGNDPYLTDSPYWLYFTPTAHKSFRIYFTGNVNTYHAAYSPPMTSAYWQVCRVWLGHYFEPEFTIQYGSLLKWVSQSDRNRSRGGSLRTNIGPRWRESSMDLIRVPEPDRATWLDIQRRVGIDRDFVLSTFAGAANREERDNTVNCVFAAADPIERWHRDYVKRRIQIEEV